MAWYKMDLVSRLGTSCSARVVGHNLSSSSSELIDFASFIEFNLFYRLCQQYTSITKYLGTVSPSIQFLPIITLLISQYRRSTQNQFKLLGL